MTSKYDHIARNPGEVKGLFDDIAPGYDRLNRVMSFGLDIGWRKRLAKMLMGKDYHSILDVCAGTGDLAIELHQTLGADVHVDGLDFSAEAVRLGQRKVAELKLSDKIRIIEGDAADLPYANDTFDALSIGFGLRNIQDRQKALAEFRRVVKPGGEFLCLEVSQPPKILAPFYYFYMLLVMPLIARIMGANVEAYRYLGRSIRAFPGAKKLAGLIEAAGWQDVSYIRLGLGSVAIHNARKPLKAVD